MGIRNKLIKPILLLLLVVAQTSATKCNCEGYFCVSDTEYQLCRDGETAGEPVLCDEGITCRNKTEIGCSRQPLCQQVSPDEGSPSANVGIPCEGLGYYPDPESCVQFYICTGYGVGRLMSCPAGTYFNEETVICTTDVPERCGRTDAVMDQTEQYTTDPPSGNENSFDCPGVGLFADPDNCQQYYQCDQALSAFLKDCAEGTYFDEELEDCVSWIPERCRGAETQQDDVASTTQDITTVYPTEGTTNEITTDNIEQTTQKVEEVTTSRTDPTTTDSPPRYDGDFICPGEGYYPDPEDCQRYYVCGVVDRPMRITCPEGTYYVDDIEFCSMDMPERCRGTNTPREDTTTERVTNGNGDGMTSTTVQTPSAFACPDEGFFPDPENCHRYYVCTDLEQAFSVFCPNDTYFDEEHMACTVEIPTRCVPEVSSTTQPTTAETRTTESTTTTEILEDGFRCPGEGYFPDPANCRNYFVCFNSAGSYIAMSLACPENTYYDEETESCTADIPERCSVGSTTSPPKTDDDFVCPEDGYYPDAKNCSVYYLCYSGFAVPLACPAETYYDDKSEFCSNEMPERCRGDETQPTTPSYTQRPTTEKNGFECPGEGYYPDTENCQDYYICYGWGSAIPVSCPDGSYFDTQSSFCTKEIPERCRVTDQPEVSTPSVPTRNEFTCRGEGYYPHPKDCQSYYICYGEDQFIQLSCPENTYYDEESSFCRSTMPDRCRNPSGDNTETTTPKNDPDKTEEEDTFRCPSEGYHPDPKDCRRYYACLGFGSPLRLTCPEDTYFDAEGFCTMNKPERCAPKESQPPQQQNTEFICPGSGRFSDPKDCQKYWICFSKNSGYPVQCPNGTYYHEDSTYCTSRKPEGCKAPDERGFTCPGRGYFPNPADCHSYYVCYTDSVSIMMQCPGNSYYHQSMEGCGPDVPQTCKNPNGGDKFICPRAGMFPDPRDCSRYHVCNLWGDSFLMKCPSGKYFNEKIRGCSAQIPPRCQSVIPPQENEFVCATAGYFPDPVNCSVYHICDSLGHLYTASCPPGLYYHEDTRACTPVMPDRCKYLSAASAACSRDHVTVLTDTGSTLNNTFVCPGKGLFPDPYDCHKFYVCYGQPRQVTCWGQTYYSEETQKCEDDMPERCGAVDTTTPPPTTPQPEGFVCPDKGLIPDPEDCHKFYVCYGEPRQVICRNGKYFDDVSQQCNEDMPERCRNNGNVTLPTTAPPTTSQPGEIVCPDKGLFAHPTDCHKFYICYGDPREVTCWGNTFYDEETQKCVEDMPERCRRDDNVTVTPPPTTTTTQDGEFICPNEGIFPDPEDCRKFYVCYGQVRHVTCHEGTYYNEETRLCGEEMPERCRPVGDQTSTSMPTTTTTTTTEMPTTAPQAFECQGFGRFPDPSDCHSFFLCNRRKEGVRYTCKDSTYFNDITGKCQPKIPDRCRSDDDSDTTTTPKSPSAFVCNEGGYYPDPDDCLRYYYCSDDDSTPVHASCPPNQFFNAAKGKCKKIKTGYECPIGNGDRFHSDGRDSDEDDDDDDDDDDDRDNEDFRCRQAGLFPDLRDCKKFYECSPSLKMKHKTCSGRTYFNERLRYCSIFTTPRCRKYGIFW